MKFDVVIGNPPYQDSSSSIYNKFIELGIKLSKDQVCMITKNNWLNSDTLKSVRNEMIKTGITDIINYPIMHEIFKDATPSVAIFRLQYNYTGLTNYTEIKNGELVHNYKYNFNDESFIPSDIKDICIVKHLRQYISSQGHFGKLTYPDECFGINSNSTVGRGDRTYVLMTDDEPTDDNNIAVIFMSDDHKPYAKYISYSDIPKRSELASKWKLLCGKSLRRDSDVMSNMMLVKPNSVCSKSWGLLYTGDSREETLRASKYIRSRLFRYLTMLLCSDGLNVLSEYRFSLIPLMDFENDTRVNWDESQEIVDDQLFRLFGLSELNLKEELAKITDISDLKLDEQETAADYIKLLINPME